MATTKKTAAKTAAKSTAKPATKAPAAETAKKATKPAINTKEFDMTAVNEFWATGAEKAQEQFAKAQASVEELASFQKENLEVLTEAATIAQKGMEALAAETTTFTQKSYEDGVAAAKEVFAATTVQEALEMQSKYTKAAFDAYFGHMKKVGEMVQTSAQDVAAPLNARATTFMEMAYKG